MAMAAENLNFTIWLGNKLKDLNTDESVFGSYITGILDGDETNDEKNEALQGILSEILENANDINGLCTEILEMWVKFKKTNELKKAENKDDVDAKLAKLLESQSLATTKQKQYTDEEKKIREAILSQYSQLSDEEEEDEGIQSGGDLKENGLEKNLNASTVVQAEKLKREQAKMESQRKKDKDKEDREKQKQIKEDKKEKRKTQKGERRR